MCVTDGVRAQIEVREMRAEITYVAAQLRHAYAQLIGGSVKNQRAFASGLIGPQIERLEKLVSEP